MRHMSFVEVIPNLKLCRSRAWYGNFEDTILHRKFWTCRLLARTTPWEIADAWRSRCVVFQVVHKHKTIGRLTSWKRKQIVQKVVMSKKNVKMEKIWKSPPKTFQVFAELLFPLWSLSRWDQNFLKGRQGIKLCFQVQVVSAKALFSTHLLQLSAEANFGKHQCSHTKACVDCVDGCNFALCSFLGLVEPRQECHGNWNFEIFSMQRSGQVIIFHQPKFTKISWNQGSHFPS